ncbi:MAG: DNA mismatch repair endonuclease MutL [Vicinamibacterales bacterium]
MPKITRLPPDLANQIAAGEVVERPASVVKELVENAIDAGARRIAVHTELGGKKLIRVEDDGEGMEPQDARLAIERHATSKIRRADDLEAIVTLGFRGEALPSIASVSHFLLRTRARGADHGTEIRVNGGLVSSETAAAAAEGTVIEVADLFYNLPARRKFLKSDAAESGQVSRVLTQIALAYPEIGFTLTSGPRTVLQCPPAATIRDRLYQLYGERNDLVEVGKEAGGLRITGFIAALAEQGPTRGVQHVFINRRMVKDRTVAHAILDAYSVASIKERSPEVHLFIEMPPDTVDVNVHPTKAEVRFRHQSLVHEVVRRAVVDALGQGDAPQLQFRSETPATAAASVPLPELFRGLSFQSHWSQGPAFPVPQALSGPAGAAASSPVNIESQSPASQISSVRPMIALGQFRDTFIIAIDDQGIAIVDQHVAHERVLFERVMERLSSGRLESQRLLVPLLLDLPPGSRDALLARTTETEQLGFEIGEFGDATLKVSAVPAVLGVADATTALRALAEDLEGLDRGAHVQEALRRIAALTACHAAVKAHDRLTPEKMAHILDELRATAHSTVCPHGRPVMLRLTRREIEKNFERI